MDTNNTLSLKDAIFFTLIVIINKLILNLPKQLIESSLSGAIISAFISGICAIVISYIISLLFKKFENHTIIDIADFLGGKILKNIFSILYIGIFILTSSIVLIKFITILQTAYFPRTPYYFILLFFIFGISYSNFLGKKAVLKTNTIIVPAISISIIFIFFGTKGRIDINRLYPILGKNLKDTFLTGINNIYIFSNICYLMFLMPLLKNKKDFVKVSIISTIISLAFLIFVTGILILTLPFLTKTNEIISVYLLARILEFGEFFQRLDAIFIFLWILSIFSYLSILMMYAKDTFACMINLNKTKNNNLSFAFGSILFSLVLFFNKFGIINYLESTIYKYYITILVFILSIFILILANIKNRYRLKFFGRK